MGCLLRVVCWAVRDCSLVAYGLLFVVRAIPCSLFVVGLLMSVGCCFLFDMW